MYIQSLHSAEEQTTRKNDKIRMDCRCKTTTAVELVVGHLRKEYESNRSYSNNLVIGFHYDDEDDDNDDDNNNKYRRKGRVGT